jgi:hypothetical protein
MSSWVAPSVAAEIWGISVAQVLERIAQGSLPSMVDGEFLFVDIAVDGFACTGPRPASAMESSIVTAAELAALTYVPLEEIDVPAEQVGRAATEEPAENICGIKPSDTDDEHLPLGEEEPSAGDIRQWRMVRTQTSRLRRPPPRRIAA